LLPTGLIASVGTGTTYNFIDNDRLPKGTNPIFNNNLVVSLQQPLLRGFGLEVNRAEIEIARASRAISYWQFVQEVREQLLNVETAYWRLSQARRTTAILAESVAQNYVTAQDMQERLGHDASPVEVANSLARWQSRYVAFLESVREIRDTEDVLKNLLNDPDIKLSEDVELVPTDTPLAVPLVLDQFAEVRRALDARSEIRQARRVIDQLRIGTGVAKNQLLPQLDVNFQYEVDGTGISADNSFDQMSMSRYISYNVGVTFSYPIGNRAREAASRRAQLQESQAIVQLQQVTDGVVQEVNASARALVVRFAQLPEQYRAVLASARNLEALQLRAKAADPSYLETELSAVEQLANNRTTLLQVLMDYNVAIIKLERDKGTLLEYNNVVVSERPPDEPQQPQK
jgi:outer membrane protein TolC